MKTGNAFNPVGREVESIMWEDLSGLTASCDMGLRYVQDNLGDHSENWIEAYYKKTNNVMYRYNPRYIEIIEFCCDKEVK